MSLDLARLEHARLRGGKLIARCPACAELGADKAGEHLSVFDEGRGPYHCIADADGKGGPHSKRIWELAGARAQPRRRPALPPRASPAPARRVADFSRLALRPPTGEEMGAVATMRGWRETIGLQLLTRRGLFWHGMVWDAGRNWPAWLVTDSSRRNAQARRMDGLPWAGIGGKKAKSLPGTEGAWPIGAAEIGDCPLVLLCEGTPDFCAALMVAWWEWEGQGVGRVAPVCMTGAGNPIAADALPLFAGKHVRIAIHDDAEGHAAARRWADQLYRAGAKTVDGFNFAGMTRPGGRPVADLADFATLLDDEAPPPALVLGGLSDL